MQFTIGADVELFGKNKVGHFVALCGKIGGTKENPLQLEDAPIGFMVQEDNVSLEYNIPVSDTRAEFINNIKYMRKRTQDILDNLGLTPATECAISFEEEELTHPNARVFGCEPDYDAWKKIENRKPVADDPNLRTAGGHIHVGTSEVDMIAGIRAMDLFLGVPSVILDSSPSAGERRKLYGKAGAMRPKPYGFEYRVLSNFWMFDDTLIAWVYNATNAALDFAYGGGKITNVEAEEIQNCINAGDTEVAQKLIEKYHLVMPKNQGEEVVEEYAFLRTSPYKNINVLLDELAGGLEIPPVQAPPYANPAWIHHDNVVQEQPDEE